MTVNVKQHSWNYWKCCNLIHKLLYFNFWAAINYSLTVSSPSIPLSIGSQQNCSVWEYIHNLFSGFVFFSKGPFTFETWYNKFILGVHLMTACQWHLKTWFALNNGCSTLHCLHSDLYIQHIKVFSENKGKSFGVGWHIVTFKWKLALV